MMATGPAVEYRVKSATESEIRSHLDECNNDFMPSLDQRTDIAAYSKRIVDNAVTFEAWADNRLIGLVATYINPVEQFAFITDVSVIRKYTGMGIASTLMQMCLRHVEQSRMREVRLEVSPENKPALLLYQKFGFTVTENKDKVVPMRLFIAQKGNGAESRRPA